MFMCIVHCAAIGGRTNALMTPCFYLMISLSPNYLSQPINLKKFISIRLCQQGFSCTREPCYRVIIQYSIVRFMSLSYWLAPGLPRAPFRLAWAAKVVSSLLSQVLPAQTILYRVERLLRWTHLSVNTYSCWNPRVPTNAIMTHGNHH